MLPSNLTTSYPDDALIYYPPRPYSGLKYRWKGTSCI